MAAALAGMHFFPLSSECRHRWSQDCQKATRTWRQEAAQLTSERTELLSSVETLRFMCASLEGASPTVESRPGLVVIGGVRVRTATRR
ncbi:MAG: hypothetical protein AB1758_03775 [Candidatus Eremiobacterota bacterium]